jgi:hypothetical protein
VSHIQKTFSKEKVFFSGRAILYCKKLCGKKDKASLVLHRMERKNPNDGEGTA